MNSGGALELFNGGGESSPKTFFNHVFNMSAESNAELMNVSQYAALGIIPVLLLNKIVQRVIPEADADKSSVELLVEVVLQMLIMFVGIVLIHRVIVYVPTYSGFNYEHLTLTNVVLAFLIILLSMQSKIGIKMNILYDRVLDLWNGTSSEDKKAVMRRKSRVSAGLQHNPSQADHLDEYSGGGMFPPAPIVQNKPRETYDNMMRGGSSSGSGDMFGPAPANAMLGGFGLF